MDGFHPCNGLGVECYGMYSGEGRVKGRVAKAP